MMRDHDMMNKCKPMEIAWAYPLPTNEFSRDKHFESPILVIGDFVYFVSESIRMSSYSKALHVIDKNSGKGEIHLLRNTNHLLPKDYFFFPYDGKAVLYTGDFVLLQGAVLLKTLRFCEKGPVTSHLLDNNHLYVSCQQHKHCSLYCIDLEQLSVVWEIDISNTKPYRAGELSFCDSKIACSGRDQLLFICPESGEITQTIKIARIDKLFCPLRLDDDTLLIGYTNWSTAGILKYQLSTQKTLWRHKRKFEGPQLRCKIYHHKDHAYWVKNDTELIRVDVNTGEEQTHLRTSPWLYTDLRLFQNGFLYGTAGADGFLNYFDGTTGQLKWSVFLKNGCAFFDVRDDSVFVGDYNKSIKQISLKNGCLQQELAVDGEVVGRITVSEEYLYTVIWGNAEKGIRLVQIKFS